MKRFHVHVSVADLSQSIRFYSTLFGAEPVRIEPDYVKWMLDDPGINFAISTRDPALGVNHVGLEVDSAVELAGLEANLKRASTTVMPEPEVTCCYAVSDKYWVTDPQGGAWEVFHTLKDPPIYGDYKPIAAIRESTALLTVSADRFFEGLGYSRVERESVPEDVKQTAQFRSLCPSSAVCMAKSL